MDNQSNYYLLLGDLRHSTRLSGTASEVTLEVTRRFLSTWGEQYRDDLVAGLDLNYGDEFVGLFHRPDRIYDIVDGLRHALRGLVDFRFTVCFGRVASLKGSTREMGGPVFKKANERLTWLKTQARFADWQTGHPMVDKTLSLLCETGHIIRRDMTSYQYDVFSLFAAGMVQTEIANRLEKFPQSVSDAISRGHADFLIELDEHIKELLSQRGQWKDIDNADSIEMR